MVKSPDPIGTEYSGVKIAYFLLKNIKKNHVLKKRLAFSCWLLEKSKAIIFLSSKPDWVVFRLRAVRKRFMS